MIPWWLFYVIPSVAADGEELRDIKAWIPLPKGAPLWIAIAALLIALLAALILWWRKRKKKEVAAPVKPSVPLDVLTLKRLDGLEEYLGREAWKPFYFGFSEVVRFYVENRFHFSATDLTTDELSQLLSHESFLESPYRDLFLKWMRRSDEVKFANLSSNASECQQLLQEARKFVQDTVPPKEEAKP